jgi:hypothetical protein
LLSFEKLSKRHELRVAVVWLHGDGSSEAVFSVFDISSLKQRKILYPKKYEFFLKMGLRIKDNPFRI